MRVVNSIRLREDEAKKSEDDCEGEKSAAAEKKRIHTKEIAMRKRKREEDKAAKELEKTLKPKRPYRIVVDIQNPFVSVFSASQMKETASESERSILQVEKSEADSSAPFMRGYIYQ